MLTPHGFPSAPGMTEIDMKIHALEQIWNIDEATASRQRRWLLRMLKFGIIIVESFTKNNLMSFASALTYSSLMAAVLPLPWSLPWPAASASETSSRTASTSRSRSILNWPIT